MHSSGKHRKDVSFSTECLSSSSNQGFSLSYYIVYRVMKCRMRSGWTGCNANRWHMTSNHYLSFMTGLCLIACSQLFLYFFIGAFLLFVNLPIQFWFTGTLFIALLAVFTVFVFFLFVSRASCLGLRSGKPTRRWFCGTIGKESENLFWLLFK